MPALKIIRQEKFCNEYVLCGKAGEAMDKAGYKNNMFNHRNAHKLLTKPHVIKRIAELREEIKNTYILKREELIEKLGKIILSGTTKDRDVISAIGLAAKIQGFLTDDINLSFNKKKVEELDDEQLREIISSESSTGNIDKA